MSCRVTVQENPCCTVHYIVSLMYFFCALNELLICREIGFEAADEIVMVSVICLAAEQAISWWIMLNRGRPDPATFSHGSKLLTSVRLLPERRIILKHLLRSQAPFLLMDCDHLLKRVSFYFSPDLFLITLQNAPKPHVFQFIAFFKMFRVEKGKVSFFGGCCQIVIFSLFAVVFFKQAAFEGGS